MIDDSKYLSPINTCLDCKETKGIFKHILNSPNKNLSKDTGKGTTKFLIRISCLICKHETTIQSFNRHFNSHTKNKKSCIKCFSTHYKNGNYCSRKCSNSRIQSEKINLKRSNTIKNKPKKDKLLQKFICICCGNIFMSIKKRKSCKLECTQKLRNEGSRKGGKRSAEIKNKRSKDEIELFNLCSKYFLHVTNNDTSIANGWDADILIHEHKIAILWNGPWHYKEMGFKNHSLKQVQNRDNIKIEEFNKVGWRVITFEDRYYSPLLAFTELKMYYEPKKLPNCYIPQ